MKHESLAFCLHLVVAEKGSVALFALTRSVLTRSVLTRFVKDSVDRR